MSKQKVSIEKLMPLADVAARLNELAAGLKAGSIVVEQGDKSLTLTPPTMVGVEIKAKQKKNKAKFSFEITWRNPEEGKEPQDVKFTTPETA